MDIYLISGTLKGMSNGNNLKYEHIKIKFLTNSF